MADTKIVDAQTGLETASGAILGALAGWLIRSGGSDEFERAAALGISRISARPRLSISSSAERQEPHGTTTPKANSSIKPNASPRRKPPRRRKASQNPASISSPVQVMPGEVHCSLK